MDHPVACLFSSFLTKRWDGVSFCSTALKKGYIMRLDQRHIKPKRSLILAGGGMRVAYQAGVLIALEEAGIKFNHVDGTSGGIFNTAMLASGLEPKAIAQRWRSLKIKNFISGRKFRDYLKPFSMTGYADADNIRKKIFTHLGIDLPTIQANTFFNASFNVCNFSDKTVEAISNKEVVEDHLIAGVSLPLMMPALQIGGDWYTDAVWIKDAHLMEAVRQGSEELWLVWAIGNSPDYLPRSEEHTSELQSRPHLVCRLLLEKKKKKKKRE